MKNNNFKYAIGLIYNNNHCDIYYGKQDRIEDLIINCKVGRAYGNVYQTRDQMLKQIEYYRMEKENTSIHNIDEEAA